ncbi:MAG: type II toxin-antitoxin system RelE/ParE family toxin [Chitinispirillia bacterium]|nr:type II toxin-antitoxin system RelE/ParE family toxin [Chitinispirillia bacterium]MCL2242671.1 type II toxin-antitoxin system RelE/ParE family toxin [Chitinispirillia bacterium]
MIKSFKCKETKKVFGQSESRKFPPEIQERAFNKLAMINTAKALNDLRQPPSNRLEQLTGDRKGQYSIRVNDQYRICFEWKNNCAENVELVDYH